MNQWQEGTIFDNIDKFANSLGYENASIAIPLAMVRAISAPGFSMGGVHPISASGTRSTEE
jgi:hypothetical protein